jgi:cell division protein FtsW
MARKLKSDKLLFLATLLLVLASVVMVYSASAVIALERFHRPYLFLVKQAMWSALGLALLGVVMRVDYRTWKQPALIWSALATVGFALVAVLFMGKINGTRRWFGVGGFGIQPSELAKLAAIFFTAALLERRMHRIDEVRYSLLPIVLVVGGITALVLIEPDYGTALSIAAVAALMVFAAGLNFKYLVYSVMALVPLSVGLLIMEPYRVKRLWSFLCPECDPSGAGFQLLQSLIAVGTGGIGGAGLMAGKQKLFYLPEPQTDFILAVIGEELGVAGVCGLLFLYGMIGYAGLRTAKNAKGAYAKLLAGGLTSLILCQALLNVYAVLGLAPLTGVPLPFVSSGSTSLIVLLCSMGLLLNIAGGGSAHLRAVPERTRRDERERRSAAEDRDRRRRDGRTRRPGDRGSGRAAG